MSGKSKVTLPPQMDMKVKSSVLEAVVYRADGSVERLGAVSFYHRNPLRMIAWRLGRLLGKSNWGVPA